MKVKSRLIQTFVAYCNPQKDGTVIYTTSFMGFYSSVWGFPFLLSCTVSIVFQPTWYHWSFQLYLLIHNFLIATVLFFFHISPSRCYHCLNAHAQEWTPGMQGSTPVGDVPMGRSIDHVSLSLSLYIYIYTFMYMYLYLYIYIYTHICICICICVYDCVYSQAERNAT